MNSVIARLAAVAAVVLSATSCATLESRSRTAEELAARGGLTRSAIQGGPFVVTVFSRMTNPTAAVVVYVEGDGLAWVSRDEVSLDPTPIHPLGLALAAADRAANVIYLARPCQYAERRRNPRCTAEMWTDRRFSEEVVASLSAALDALVANHRRLHLVGYSGGGAIAALLAARRSDVASLRTVAGNLDHVALHRAHGVDQLKASLNAADHASALAQLPQIHYVGGQDKLITRAVSDSYVGRSGTDRCIQVVRIAGATHAEGWDVWSSLAGILPDCRP